MASQHPVVESSEWAYQVREHSAIREIWSLVYTPHNTQATDLVRIDENGVRLAAKYVRLLRFPYIRS